MKTNNKNRIEWLSSRLDELNRLMDSKKNWMIRESLPLSKFIHGSIKNVKVVQNEYGQSLVVTTVNSCTVTPSEVIEHEYKTSYYPLYKNYDGMYDGKVIDPNDLHNMNMLLMTRPGYPVIYRVSLTSEEAVQVDDYDSLLKEYNELFTEFQKLTMELPKKFNIFNKLILY